VRALIASFLAVARNSGEGEIDLLAGSRAVPFKRAYTRSELEQLLSQTRFGPVEIEESTIGLEVSTQREQ